MKFSRQHEATITRADFFRILPAATGESDIREVGDRFFGSNWSVKLTAIPPLKIGIIQMERFRVEIDIEDMTPDEQDRFLRRFTLYYQRGGG